MPMSIIASGALPSILEIAANAGNRYAPRDTSCVLNDPGRDDVDDSCSMIATESAKHRKHVLAPLRNRLEIGIILRERFLA
jgi:hypothetical protein